jgi:putative heme-binding domain-containing protein
MTMKISDFRRGTGAARFVFFALLSSLPSVAFARSTQDPAALDPKSDDPEVERKLLQIPPEFEIQLFASDPLVKRPIAMNFDPQGRLWVLCVPRYPQILPGEESDGYVLVLEDREGKGRADTSHVFLSGLGVATGLIPGDGGAYLCEGERLYHYKDTRGTGTADTSRVLLAGFGTQDTHHTLNTFQWGPDGCLYFHQGVFLTSTVETPWGIRRLAGGGVWQLRTSSLDLEVYDRTLRGNNTWGHIWDRFGRSIFASAWVSDIHLGLPDTPLNSSGGPDFEGSVKITKLGGDRHSGLTMISGRHFPPDWQGNLITGGFLSQRINRTLLKDDGEHFSTQPLAPLVVSHHQKFRPIDVKMGPDGALYILDWYNLIIQHNQVNFHDPRRDHLHGRIWRISYKDRPLVPRMDLAALGTPELLGHLGDPEQWTRDQARRVLAERDPKETAKALGAWVESIRPAEADSEERLLEALWIYQSMDQVEPALLSRLLRAKDAHVRAAATAVLGAWQDRLNDPVGLVAVQASDPNIRVRLEAVLAAERIPRPASLEAALRALDHPMDPLVEFELRKATLVLKPYWYPAFLSRQVTFGNNPRHLSFALSSARISDAVPKLLELYAGGKIPPEGRADLLASVAALGKAEQLSTVLDAVAGDALGTIEDRAKVLEALVRAARDRKVLPAGDLGRLCPLARRDDRLGISALRAAGAWKIEELRPDLVRASGDSSPAERRQAAVASLAELGGAASVSHLAGLAEPGHAYEARLDAVAGLASLDLGQAAALAARLFRETPPPGIDPARAIAAFLRREGGDDALARALAQEKPSAEVALAGLREINAAGWPFPRLSEAFRAAAPVTLRKREFTPDLQRRLVELARSEGDPVRGERLFRSAALGCTRCHAIAGGGGTVGPDLAAIGATAQPDFLVEHLLLPTKSVKEGFTAFEFLTQDGDVVSGIKVRENPQEIVLRDAGGEEVVVTKSKIKRQRDVRTLMPLGLTDGLSDAEVGDLVRFLSELGKPGPFVVGPAQVARQWKMLARLPDSLLHLAPDRAGHILQDDPDLVWAVATSTVAGLLPLPEVTAGPASKVAVVRAGLQVTSAGKFSLEIGDVGGLKIWVDGDLVSPQERLGLDLAKGLHTIVAWVDLSVRKTPSLRWELSGQAERGAGAAQWAGNK